MTTFQKFVMCILWGLVASIIYCFVPALAWCLVGFIAGDPERIVKISEHWQNSAWERCSLKMRKRTGSA